MKIVNYPSFPFVKLSLVDINTDSRMRVILIAILQDKYAPLFG